MRSEAQVKELLAIRLKEREAYDRAGILANFDGERAIKDLEWILEVKE